jgi:hypothetical protein
MIIDKTLKITTKGCRKIEIFKNHGYDTSLDFIDIKIEDLNKGSGQKVNVECDFCKKNVFISFKEYNRNILIGGKYSCSKKCGSLKAKESNIIKWGVEYPMMLVDIQEKSKKTNLEKYGFEFLQQSPEIKIKTLESVMSKYGTNHISKNETIRLKTSKISHDINYIRYLENNISLFICDLEKNHNFEINGDNYYHRKKSKLPLCTICHPINDSSSLKENELYKFISDIYKNNIIRNYRNEIEIDIYLPDIKLGFEFNGLYWHSEKWKDKWYHLKKREHFQKLGIRIINIWEDDWLQKRPIIESQIINWIGYNKNNRIFARKCDIRVISPKESNSFLNSNHIQGSDKSSIKIGLFFQNELVSTMTFNNREGRKLTKDWNLSRFCNKLNTSVIGGASKLLNFFIKNWNPSRIISYADRDWSDGSLYYKLGFEMIKMSDPDYKYIKNGKRRHKSNYKKSNLNTNLTESKEMERRNIQKIWDCGKIKFELKLNSIH